MSQRATPSTKAPPSPADSDAALQQFLNASVSSESGDLVAALNKLHKMPDTPASDASSSRDSDLLSSRDLDPAASAEKIYLSNDGPLNSPARTFSPQRPGDSSPKANAPPHSAAKSVAASEIMTSVQASVDLGTDSETEETEKARFFSKVEKQWSGVDHPGGAAPPDYSLLNAMASSVDSSVGGGSPMAPALPPKAPPGIPPPPASSNTAAPKGPSPPRPRSPLGTTGTMPPKRPDLAPPGQPPSTPSASVAASTSLNASPETERRPPSELSEGSAASTPSGSAPANPPPPTGVNLRPKSRKSMLRVASQGGVLDKPPPPPSVLFGSGAVSEPEGGASPKPSLEPEGASRATAPSPAPVGPASGDATARSSVPGSSLLKPPTAPLSGGVRVSVAGSLNGSLNGSLSGLPPPPAYPPPSPASPIPPPPNAFAFTSSRASSLAGSPGPVGALRASTESLRASARVSTSSIPVGAAVPSPQPAPDRSATGFPPYEAYYDEYGERGWPAGVMSNEARAAQAKARRLKRESAHAGEGLAGARAASPQSVRKGRSQRVSADVGGGALSMTNAQLTERFQELCAQVDTMQRKAVSSPPTPPRSRLVSPQKGPAPVASPAGAARTGDSLHRTSLVHEKELIESNLNLQARVEHLQHQLHGFEDMRSQLSAAESQRREMLEQNASQRAIMEGYERQLSEFKSFQERSERRLREGYEGRLAEASKQRAELQHKIDKLEQDGPRRRLLAEGAEAKLSEGELKALRQEILEQETLLKGYQAENEAAVAKLRSVQTEARERENAAIQENGKLRAWMESEMARLNQAKGEEGVHLAKLLKTEAALERVREEWRARELELKHELEFLRTAKRDTEARMAGVSMPCVQAEHLAVKELQKELAQVHARHAEATARLEARLQWFAENQELVAAANDNLRSEREARLRAEQRVEELTAEGAHRQLPGTGPGDARSTGGGAGAVALGGRKSAGPSQRVRQLEAQVRELEAALASKHPPNTLAALIQASKPSMEETATVQRLNAQVAHLEQTLEVREEEAEQAMRTLRQEHERVRITLEAKLKNADPSSHRAVGTGTRVRELERQVEELRTFYSKKLKEANARAEEAERRLHEQADRKSCAGGPAAAPARKRLVQGSAVSDEHLHRLETELAEQRGLVEEAQEKQAAAERLQQETQEHEAKAVRDLTNEVLKTRRQLALLSASHAGARQRGHAASTSGPASHCGPGSQRREAWAAHSLSQHCIRFDAQDKMQCETTTEDMQHLERKLGSLELSLASLQRAYTEAVEKGAIQRMEAEQALARLQEQHARQLAGLNLGDRKLLQDPTLVAELEELRPKLEDLETRFEAAERSRARLEEERNALKTRVAELKQEVAAAQGDDNAMAAAYKRLQMRVGDMDSRHTAQEKEWNAMMRETQRMCQMEIETVKHHASISIQAKNAEIQRFQVELDSILQAATQMYQNGVDLSSNFAVHGPQRGSVSKEWAAGIAPDNKENQENSFLYY